MYLALLRVDLDNLGITKASLVFHVSVGCLEVETLTPLATVTLEDVETDLQGVLGPNEHPCL